MAVRCTRPTRLCRASMTGLLAVLAVSYALSPYVALWRVSVALRSHNLAALRADVDWGQVRDGLKLELTGGAQPTVQALKTAMATSSTSDDELPDFGDSFAKTAVSNVVDEDCDAEHVEAMLGHGAVPRGSLIEQAKHMVTWAFFTGPESFQAMVRVGVDPHEAPVRVEMVFTRHHGWRVTSVWLPTQMLSTPEANAT